MEKLPLRVKEEEQIGGATITGTIICGKAITMFETRGPTEGGGDSSDLTVEELKTVSIRLCASW